MFFAFSDAGSKGVQNVKATYTHTYSFTHTPEGQI